MAQLGCALSMLQLVSRLAKSCPKLRHLHPQLRRAVLTRVEARSAEGLLIMTWKPGSMSFTGSQTKQRLSSDALVSSGVVAALTC